jgi:hypothetical protein
MQVRLIFLVICRHTKKDTLEFSSKLSCQDGISISTDFISIKNDAGTTNTFTRIVTGSLGEGIFYEKLINFYPLDITKPDKNSGVRRYISKDGKKHTKALDSKSHV